ncbi:MAG: hypothetical protein AAGI91_03180 [Bacteroidota bacterium]
MAAACLLSRLATAVSYIEDADSLRFARSVADGFDVAALQPHFPGYPVFWAAAKSLYLVTGSFSVAFALVGGLATLGLIAAGLVLLGVRLRSVRGLAWAAVVFFCPLGWLMGTRYMPDLLGLAAALGAVALALRAMQSRRPADAVAAGLLAGLLAGLRLSYLPFVAVPLVGLLAVQSRLRVPLVAAGLAGTVVWLVPLVVDTGWAALVAAAQQQTVGHFMAFGGTALAEPAGWGTRLGRTIEAVWADGLGGWWPGRHGLTVLVALGLAAAFVAGVQALREDEAVRRALWWLLGCAAVYAVWIVAYQNVLYKSRHALPLIAVALFVLALGGARLWRHRWGRFVALDALAVYAAVALVLAAQHRQPTAIAQATEHVRTLAAAQPDLHVVSTPLVTFMLEAQRIEAVFLDTDDAGDLARLTTAYTEGLPIVSVGAPVSAAATRPVRADTFYHNPYVNRMWPEVPVYGYPPARPAR